MLGRGGTTLEQIKKTLHFDEVPDGQLFEAIGNLSSSLIRNIRKEYSLQIANKLYGKDGYTFLKEFLEMVKRDLRAEMEQVCFKKKLNSI